MPDKQVSGRWQMIPGWKLMRSAALPAFSPHVTEAQDATDAERIERLLEELSQCAEQERRARFVCVIAIADPQGRSLIFRQEDAKGGIAHAPRGTGGFGYDPVFIPDGFEQTFGELPPEIKQNISHRALRSSGRALLSAQIVFKAQLDPCCKRPLECRFSIICD